MQSKINAVGYGITVQEIPGAVIGIPGGGGLLITKYNLDAMYGHSEIRCTFIEDGDRISHGPATSPYVSDKGT